MKDVITKALNSLKDPNKGTFLQRFFKTGPGEYAEGDKFIGITVPQQRQVAKAFWKETELDDIAALLKSPVHEYRLTALFILVLKFEKTKSEEVKKEIFRFYIHHLDYVNNWDLVDSSAGKIAGAYLFERDRKLLYKLAKEDHLWKQRVAVIATQYFIRHNDFKDTLALAEVLLSHPHDLIHKAVGWMLREIGNKDEKILTEFLERHYKKMPRTMLRYAIEKFNPEKRLAFLKNEI